MQKSARQQGWGASWLCGKTCRGGAATMNPRGFYERRSTDLKFKIPKFRRAVTSDSAMYRCLCSRNNPQTLAHNAAAIHHEKGGCGTQRTVLLLSERPMPASKAKAGSTTTACIDPHQCMDQRLVIIKSVSGWVRTMRLIRQLENGRRRCPAQRTNSAQQRPLSSPRATMPHFSILIACMPSLSAPHSWAR